MARIYKLAFVRGYEGRSSVAIWHLRTKVISRARGQSVVAAAAYRAGTKLQDERYGMVHDYTRKEHVAHSEIMLPEGAPDHLMDRETLWNAVEASERRVNSQLAREVEVALPRELSQEDRIALVRQFVREQFVSQGMIADFSIHAPTASDGEEAPHAHILLTMREIGPEGFGKKRRDWNGGEKWFEKGQGLHEAWREGWERAVNDMLRARGFEARIDRRSHQARGRVFEPSLHEGASWQERRRCRQAGEEPSGEEARRVIENAARRARSQARIEADPAVVLHELVHHRSTFTKRDVARVLNRYVDDERVFLNLKARVLGHEEAVLLGRDARGEDRYSTRAQLQVERDILSMGDQLSAQRHRRIDGDYASAVLGKSGLSDEQRAAVLHLVSDGSLLLASGIAGAGKTAMLRSAVDLWREVGLTPRGVALAATAASVLEVGTAMPSGTVARLLGRLDRGEETLSAQDVIVLDEAGMLHSRHMRRLMAHVAQAGAKLVMIGDSEQIQAVEAGAPFRALEGRLGGARLEETRRQQDGGDRQATVLFATGRTEDGLAHYEASQALRGMENRDRLLRAAADGYLSDRSILGAEGVMLLAHRRDDVAQLNAMLREELMRQGAVDEGRVYALSRGERALGRGDRIVFLKNDYALGVRNGMTGEVVQAGDALLIRVGEKEIRIDPAVYPDIDHGYAQTLHKGQGATAERVHVVLTSSMDRNLTYVGMTRHRSLVRAYWSREDEDSIKALKARLARSGLKDMTTDYAQARHVQPPAGERVRPVLGALRREVQRVAQQRREQELRRQEEDRRRAEEVRLAADMEQARALATRWDQLIEAYSKGVSKGGVAYDKARAQLVAYGRTLRDEIVSGTLLREQGQVFGMEARPNLRHVLRATDPQAEITRLVTGWEWQRAQEQQQQEYTRSRGRTPWD